ncbi:MAG: hypothetical protein Q9P44_00520 [Anaerolineae bacterium]|nr:hypothetical protein [Anaerolineae bacterium]
MTQVPPLDESNVSGYFNPQQHIFYIHYKNRLSADASTKAYAWLFKYGVPMGNTIRAFIFDFTAVKRFQRDNTRATQNQSRRANATADLSAIPAALIVKTPYQEQLVLLSMKANKVEERTRICHSQTEAHKFIIDFHKKYQNQNAAQES